MYLEIEESLSAGYTPALDEFDRIYAFLHSRVGNRFDAEDLTQQVALKALPRLREGAPPESVRAYLYATARSVLAVFWSDRLRLPESELSFEIPDGNDRSSPEPSAESAAWLERTLSALPAHYRRVLELRFLQGRSIREAANEMQRTEGALKVMQLRALRAAARQPTAPTPSRPARRPRAVVPGSASVTLPAVPVA
ncbi:MAG TPA: sigma-70 family RNA polymerase sigma factor [Candidatus Dormibacteraeota bacterium]|nr:sigma-70 family RNA polymerase sigma factor [Candidatus Dormibacteraeota bacterium]